MPQRPEQSMTREDCHAYLDRATFHLRSPDYGEKYPKWPGSVGLEVEMLPVFPPQERAGPPELVRLQGGEPSIASSLRGLAEQRGWKVEDAHDDGAKPDLLKVLLEKNDNVSFEPGGQVEFSSQPYPCLSDAVKRTRFIQNDLDATFANIGVDLLQIGINPWHSVDQVGLQMDKPRYRAMDAYYRQIGEYGPRMMRQTCTVQVNLDFGPDENSLARRYMGGLLVAPVAAATFANSPFVDGRDTGIAGFRNRVWRHTDPTHTGLPGLESLMNLTTRDECVATYLDFVLSANVVFIASLGYRVPERPVTFGEWLEHPIDGVWPSLEDFETHLSLMFPEVRPRGFLELRSVDCQARPFQVAPASYYTGLLYRDEILDKLIELLMPKRYELRDLLWQAETGLAEEPLRRLAQTVMELAREGFDDLPSCFKTEGSEAALRVFHERFTGEGLTPADALREQARRDGTDVISYSGLKRLEEEWHELMV